MIHTSFVLSLIIPTYNEAESLPSFLSSVAGALHGIPHQIIIVDDDSPDGTWKIARGLEAKYPGLRVIRRKTKRGLSSAVADGFSAAKGDVLAVMDADGQHDPAVLPLLLRDIRDDGADVAIASRYIAGGSTGAWQRNRRLLSRWGTTMARLLAPPGVTDPLSGFFAMRAGLYQSVARHIRPSGFKILLEILARAPRATRIAERPLAFRPRAAGISKLNVSVQIAFAWQMARLGGRRWIGFCMFLLACGVVAALIIPRVQALAPLYLNAEIRRHVEVGLKAYADEEGLPVSSVLLRHIRHDVMEIEERLYRRGTDQVRCVALPYDFSPPRPCAS